MLWKRKVKDEPLDKDFEGAFEQLKKEFRWCRGFVQGDLMALLGLMRNYRVYTLIEVIGGEKDDLLFEKPNEARLYNLRTGQLYKSTFSSGEKACAWLTNFVYGKRPSKKVIKLTEIRFRDLRRK